MAPKHQVISKIKVSADFGEKKCLLISPLSFSSCTDGSVGEEANEDSKDNPNTNDHSNYD